MIDGGWGAAQMVSVTPQRLTLCALDWYSTEPPTLDQLAGARPLGQRHPGVGLADHRG